MTGHLTEVEREAHMCCLSRRACTETHFHEADVERIIAARADAAETVANHRVFAAGPASVYCACDHQPRDVLTYNAHVRNARVHVADVLAAGAVAAARSDERERITAAVESVLNPDGHRNARDFGRAAVWADDIRAALKAADQ